MADSSQHSQDNTGPGRGGAGQTVVELSGASRQGLVLWSRQRFETGVELQLRLRAELLPEVVRAMAGGRGWVNLRGFVVSCRPERRDDGSFGFHVSLLLADLAPAPQSLPPDPGWKTIGLDIQPPSWPMARGLGWN